MRHSAPQAISPVSFHPAKKKREKNADRTKIIQSGLLREFYFAVNCLTRALEVSRRIAEPAKGAADFISIMTPIPRGITGDGAFCTPPPLPSVEHSSGTCQTLLLRDTAVIQLRLPYALCC